MTLKVRRILSIIFIILFLVMTPAIMLYAAGYRLGNNGLSIQKTGMFIIDSRPKGAKIYIDGELQKTWPNSIITTPAKIKNLLPKEYELKLELDGYWSWQKKLVVKPGASTFAENIYLFKNDLPVQILPADIESIRLWSGKNQSIILSKNLITFLNLNDESQKIIQRDKLVAKNIFFSKDQNKIVIDNYLYNLINLNSSINLKNFNINSFNYKWDDNILYYQDKLSIYKLEENNKPIKIVNNKIFNDYLVKNNYLYLIIETKQGFDLEIIDIDSGKNLKNINLPAAGNYSFINTENNLLNIYDKNHKTLFLINPMSTFEPLVAVINNLKTASWNDSNSLVYSNDFEIWLYDLSSKNKTLITRISDTITNAIMHPSKDYIIYSTEKTINTIELDERDKKNVNELVKFDSVNSFILTNGDILYFSGKIGNSEGLYKKSLMQ